jgi:hypothetical protein
MFSRDQLPAAMMTWNPWHHHTLLPFRLTARRMLSPSMAAPCGDLEACHTLDLSSPNVPTSMNAANDLSVELPPGCLSRGPLRLVLPTQHFRRRDAALAHRPPSPILAKKTLMRALVVVELQTHPILDFIILPVRTRGTHHVRETCTFARSRALSAKYTKSRPVRGGSGRTGVHDSRMEGNMNLERDVILVDVVPLLKADLLGARSRLGRDELLEVADGVVGVALDPHLLAQAVVAHHLNHPACLSQPRQCPDDPPQWLGTSPRHSLSLDGARFVRGLSTRVLIRDGDNPYAGARSHLHCAWPACAACKRGSGAKGVRTIFLLRSPSVPAPSLCTARRLIQGVFCETASFL